MPVARDVLILELNIAKSAKVDTSGRTTKCALISTNALKLLQTIRCVASRRPALIRMVVMTAKLVIKLAMDALESEFIRVKSAQKGTSTIWIVRVVCSAWWTY